MSERDEEAAPRFREIDRKQVRLEIVDVERLIPEDHIARNIWEFVGRLNLEAFYGEIKAVTGVAGREPWHPRMMITLWLYGYSRGIGSAREISRLTRYDPAFAWITGGEVVNYHSLSTFRSHYGRPLRNLFVEVLAVMSSQGLITMVTVMHDGTKIEAQASGNSFRREETINEHLKRAQAQVRRMEELTEENSDKKGRRKLRNEKQRVQRLEKALEELKKVRRGKTKQADKDEARVSMTDPEARVMKNSQGGYEPSYNLQVSTESKNKMVVGFSVSQSSADARELDRALEQIEETTGKLPSQLVVDGGYISAQNIMSATKNNIELYGPSAEPVKKLNLKMCRERKLGTDREFSAEAFTYDQVSDRFMCPAGRMMRLERTYTEGQNKLWVYRAKLSECKQCSFKPQCCPTNQTNGRSVSRTVLLEEVATFRERSKSEWGKEVYKKRSEVAENPFMWIKEKFNARRFRLRGLAKVKLECLWLCLAYNLVNWIRLEKATPPAEVLVTT